MITWLIVATLATIAGVLYGLDKSFKPFTYFQLLLPIFAAAIVGGLGNPLGAIAGGLVIAFSEVMITYAWKKVAGYALPELLAPDGLAQLLSTDYKFAVSFCIPAGGSFVPAHRAFCGESGMNEALRNTVYFAAVAMLMIGTGYVYSWNTTLQILNMGLISAIMALGVNLQWGFAGLFNVGIMGLCGAWWAGNCPDFNAAANRSLGGRWSWRLAVAGSGRFDDCRRDPGLCTPAQRALAGPGCHRNPDPWLFPLPGRL